MTLLIDLANYRAFVTSVSSGVGAWSADGGTPYYNLGLEPCIGSQDSLAEAVTEYHQFATLPSRGSKHDGWRST